MRKFTDFSGAKVEDNLLNRVENAKNYGTIALAYVTGKHPFTVDADHANDWTRIAAHHAHKALRHLRGSK